MRSKTHIIFDMDGTLVDSSQLLANTINYVRSKLSLPPLSNEEVRRGINDMALNPAQYFYNAPAFEPLHEEYFQEYYLANHHKETKLYDGIKELLERLRKTHALSLATNAYAVSTKPLLEALGIGHYFDTIVCGDEVPKAKPHPEMLERIISFYGVKRDRFVMIGDGMRDLKAAQNAKISGLLVEWGFSEHQEAISSVKALRERLGVEDVF